jgi:hypothetical protein
MADLVVVDSIVVVVDAVSSSFQSESATMVLEVAKGSYIDLLARY